MTGATFPALSVRQPWADLIVWGIKDVENRTWRTDFRGNLLIHAGMRIDEEGVGRVERLYGLLLPLDYRSRTGAVLGMVRLVDCVRASRSPFFSGPYGFVVEGAVDFGEPVLFPGRLGIFPVPRAVLRGTPAFDAAAGA
ncbi:MAG TPA: ASCH domain-containing protein [Thermoanaerobaculia bacterium]|nr:ASCH domain-containing protein [Thermoanaerobaculia bacterium]